MDPRVKLELKLQKLRAEPYQTGQLSTPRSPDHRFLRREKNQEAARGHLLSGASSRHDAAEAAPATTKGCATFWVGAEAEAEALQRFAVPVALLGHPLILELLAEASGEYGYSHEGAIVVPCGAERFRQAVDAAEREHGQHHHHHLRLPHLAACFRPSHVVA